MLQDSLLEYALFLLLVLGTLFLVVRAAVASGVRRASRRERDGGPWP